MGHTSIGFRTDVWPDLADEVQSRIETFGADVLRFGQAQNLVSRRDPEAEVARLIEESVRGGALLRSVRAERVLEVGSGAGFPGLVLASMHPDAAFLLVERRRARCDFLERCVRRLDLSQVQVRAEDVRSLDVGEFDVVTGKAVVDAVTFLRWVRPYLGPSGHVLLFQRSTWDVPPGWKIESSVVSLTQDAKAPRVAALVRQADS